MTDFKEFENHDKKKGLVQRLLFCMVTTSSQFLFESKALKVTSVPLVYSRQIT
ncbi:MAG: hypothetical protein H0X63_12795 [Flavobacteriales bacterium]|jgi:thermostable 8-oxoguanine DNA glycosylase|nr:hypothetical protein [Flavobacteriales bacterium]